MTGSLGQTVESVSGISQTRDDVAALVEVIVDGGDHQVGGHPELVHQLAEVLDALGGGEDAQTGDVVGAASDQELDRAAQGSAGGQHRVEDEALTAGEVVRQSLGVGHRLEGLLVAGHPDEADLGAGHQAHHALEHSQTGTHDRHHQGLGMGQCDPVGLGDRGLHRGRLDPHMAGCLVGQQGDQFLDEMTELRAGGVDRPQQSDLV